MKIAVIGMGSIGQRHYRNLQALGYSGVRGWDDDPIKGDPIDWSWKPEVVLICTPPDSHMGIALEAALSGAKGIFVEKPISDTLTIDDSSVITAAEKRSVVTMVGCNWRFAPGMHDLLFRPGPLAIWADIPIPEERQTTPLFDIGIHLLDLERWSGHKRSLIYFDYAAPYRIWIACGDSVEQWDKGPETMYLSELRHFMRCVKTGEPTGNDFRFAAETLRIALGVNDA